MIKHKLAYFISSAAVLGSAGLFPAFAAQDTVVAGNGAFSENHVSQSQRNEMSVRQSNDTNISNSVRNNLDTGHNSANFNTGGDVMIRTGDANANTNIQNTAGYNAAYVSGNGCSSCDNRDSNVSIVGNGAFSENSVRVSDNNSHSYKQDNTTRFDNNVRNNSNTGYNNSGYDNGESYDHPKYNNSQPYFVKDDHKNYDNNKNKKDYGVSSYNMNGYNRNNYGSSYKSNYMSSNEHMKFYNNNSYSKNNNCGCDYFNQKYQSYKPFYGGNTQGDVTIRTGNANSNNWLANMAGYNYLD